MQILLLSMPDSSEHTPTIAIRIPNGALASLAGNIDPHHHVAIADLVVVQSTVRPTVERLMSTLKPDVVGLSVMTFQRATARRIIALVRAMKPDVFIVVGGYDPTLASEEWTHPALGVDAIVRGEGDLTFRELIRAIEHRQPLCGIDGLWFRDGDVFRRNRPRAVARLDAAPIRPPNRSARVLTGYTMMGRPIDVVETSRGCTFDCSFCSIIEMRGRNFHRFPIASVIDDIADAHRRGARSIFLVDDNITLDVSRFEELCREIVRAGLNHIDYLAQAMTASIAAGGDRLAALMQQAGFRYVFLGIENVLDEDLKFLKARSKNSRHRAGQRTNTAFEAVATLHRHDMLVVGGLIVGNPDDRSESIQANLTFARRHVDWPYIQHPTPYPGTPMTRDFEQRGLITNSRVDEYRRDDGRDSKRISRAGRDRVPALEGRALDEGPSHAEGLSARPSVRAEKRPADALTHVQGNDVAFGAGTRARARGVRTLPCDPRPRTRVRRLAGSAGAGAALMRMW